MWSYVLFYSIANKIRKQYELKEKSHVNLSIDLDNTMRSVCVLAFDHHRYISNS